MTDIQVLYDGYSNFEHYKVTEQNYYGRQARVLFSGSGIAAQSGIALDNSSELLFGYNERFMELVRGLAPERLLIIGGGACTLPTAVSKEFPLMRIDIVERDPMVIDLGRQFFSFVETAHMHVYLGDGFAYVGETTNYYDLIILDVFSEAVIPLAFQTEEFAQRLRRVLAPAGLVTMNVIAAGYGPHSQTLHNQVAIFQHVFREVSIFPANGDLSPEVPQNYILTATNFHKEVQRWLRYNAMAVSWQK